jgi:hypothetical protein
MAAARVASMDASSAADSAANLAASWETPRVDSRVVARVATTGGSMAASRVTTTAASSDCRWAACLVERRAAGVLGWGRGSCEVGNEGRREKEQWVGLGEKMWMKRKTYKLGKRC